MMSKSTITEFVTRDPYQWKITFEWVDNLLATSFVPLILVGTFANTRSAAIFFVNRKYVKMNGYVLLTVTLCLSDVLMLLFTGVPTTVSMFQLREPIPYPFCTISGWFLNFNTRLCSFLTTCICSMRCIVVLLPFRSKFLLRKRYLLLMLFVCAALAFLSASLPFYLRVPLFGNPSYRYRYYQYNMLVGFCFFVLPVSYSDSPTSWYLSLLLVEGVFFVPLIISVGTCSLMVPVLRSQANKGLSRVDRNYKAIWSICRITLFTVACYAPQFVWAVLDKVCEFHTWGSEIGEFCTNLSIGTYLNYSVTHILMNLSRASASPFVANLSSYIRQLKKTRIRGYTPSPPLPLIRK